MKKVLLLAVLAIIVLSETSCASGCQRRKAAYFKRYVEVEIKHEVSKPHVKFKNC